MIMSKIKRFMEKVSSISNIVIIKEDNKIIRTTSRFVKVILIVLLTVAVGWLILSPAIAFFGNMVIFDYMDNEQCISTIISRDFDPKAEGYLMKYPFFANPLILSGVSPGSVGYGGLLAVYNIPTGVDDEKINIYEAVNSPIRVWVFAISAKYHDRLNVDYTVEKNGKTLTVIFSGTADWEGEKIPIEQKFVFDIENADVDNLPKWINEDEICDEVKEWKEYWSNPNEVPMPSWAEWLILFPNKK